MTSTGTHFTCDLCQQRFKKGWTDEEAAAESATLFGFVPEPDDRAVICDDCHEEVIAWARTQPGILI